jgi:hypothetical protein
MGSNKHTKKIPILRCLSKYRWKTGRVLYTEYVKNGGKWRNNCGYRTIKTEEGRFRSFVVYMGHLPEVETSKIDHSKRKIYRLRD